MSNRYAENTSVPISRSREELERTLERFGATGSAWIRDDEAARVTFAFKRNGHGYRFFVYLPNGEEKAFAYTPTGQRREKSTAKGLAEQEGRRRFRSLANYVKALMDAADTGIISAEEALLPYLILPSGETVGEAVRDALPALEDGRPFDIRKALGSGMGERTR